MSISELVGMFVGLLLTLFVFSYILGDNALFRIATHLFIGVVTGYLVVMVVTMVILPQIVAPLLSGDPARMYVALVPLVLGLLVLSKGFPRVSGLGTPVVAFLVGVGAAVAIGGAVSGTIFPQAEATIKLFDIRAIQVNQPDRLAALLFNGSVILIGTLTTLIYFHFGVRSTKTGWTARAEWIEWIAKIGQVFIAITFGVLFAGIYAAALTALVERWQVIVNFVLSFL